MRIPRGGSGPQDAFGETRHAWKKVGLPTSPRLRRTTRSSLRTPGECHVVRVCELIRMGETLSPCLPGRAIWAGRCEVRGRSEDSGRSGPKHVILPRTVQRQEPAGTSGYRRGAMGRPGPFWAAFRRSESDIHPRLSAAARAGAICESRQRPGFRAGLFSRRQPSDLRTDRWSAAGSYLDRRIW